LRERERGIYVWTASVHRDPSTKQQIKILSRSILFSLAAPSSSKLGSFSPLQVFLAGDLLMTSSPRGLFVFLDGQLVGVFYFLDGQLVGVATSACHIPLSMFFFLHL
jgi:hypothetical protein